MGEIHGGMHGRDLALAILGLHRHVLVRVRARRLGLGLGLGLGLSPTSPPHLPHICPTSAPHLPHICPTSAQHLYVRMARHVTCGMAATRSHKSVWHASSELARLHVFTHGYGVYSYGPPSELARLHVFTHSYGVYSYGPPSELARLHVVTRGTGRALNFHMLLHMSAALACIFLPSIQPLGKYVAFGSPLVHHE